MAHKKLGKKDFPKDNTNDGQRKHKLKPLKNEKYDISWQEELTAEELKLLNDNEEEVEEDWRKYLLDESE